MTDPHEMPDVHDTAEVRQYLMREAHDAEIWRIAWDARMNGLNPSKCSAWVRLNIWYLRLGISVLFTISGFFAYHLFIADPRQHTSTTVTRGK